MFKRIYKQNTQQNQTVQAKEIKRH